MAGISPIVSCVLPRKKLSGLLECTKKKIVIITFTNQGINLSAHRLPNAEVQLIIEATSCDEDLIKQYGGPNNVWQTSDLFAPKHWVNDFKDNLDTTISIVLDGNNDIHLALDHNTTYTEKLKPAKPEITKLSYDDSQRYNQFTFTTSKVNAAVKALTAGSESQSDHPDGKRISLSFKDSTYAIFRNGRKDSTTAQIDAYIEYHTTNRPDPNASQTPVIVNASAMQYIVVHDDVNPYTTFSVTPTHLVVTQDNEFSKSLVAILRWQNPKAKSNRAQKKKKSDDVQDSDIAKEIAAMKASGTWPPVSDKKRTKTPKKRALVTQPDESGSSSDDESTDKPSSSSSSKHSQKKSRKGKSQKEPVVKKTKKLVKSSTIKDKRSKHTVDVCDGPINEVAIAAAAVADDDDDDEAESAVYNLGSQWNDQPLNMAPSLMESSETEDEEDDSPLGEYVK